MAKSSENTNRHHGGPGSSHQRSDRPDPTRSSETQKGTSTGAPTSKVSGGGGERDRVHSHDPHWKGNQPQNRR